MNSLRVVLIGVLALGFWACGGGRKSDPCRDLSCPANAFCEGGECYCETGYWPSMDWTSCVAIDLESGLVAAYPFSGNAEDSSGNGIHGTVNGASLAADRFGAANSAYAFDGVDDYISLGADPRLGIFTQTNWSFSFWFKPARENGEAQNILNGLTHKPRICYSPAEKIHLANLDPDGVYVPQASALPNSSPLDTWSHVVLVTDGTYHNVYVNGVFSDHGVYMPVQSGLPVDFRFGSTLYPEEAYEGLIDDVIFYDRALLPEEAEALYVLSSQ